MADLLVDTDVFVDHIRGAARIRVGPHTLSYSVVTRCELFAGRGIVRSLRTSDDGEGMDRVEGALADQHAGLVFANLVDFDTLYGHRNDVEGYAANLERFDARLGRVLPQLRSDDLLVVTGDHGNDPTTPSTDHAREFVPLLATGRRARVGIDLGTRQTFADLGQTLAELFGVGPLAHGTSFLGDIIESRLP